MFLLVGNIHDYAFSPERGYLPVVDRIERSRVLRKDWVIRYSLSNGFSRPVRGSSTPDSDQTPFEHLGLEDVVRSGATDRSAREALDRDLQIMEQLLGKSYDGGISLIIDNVQLLIPPDSKNVTLFCRRLLMKQSSLKRAR